MYWSKEIFLAYCYYIYHEILCYNILFMAWLSVIYLFPLTRELRALHGAWATPRSSSILEKTDRSSARSICRGLVPRIFTPFRCKGAARLFGICPPTDTMLPEQPWRAEDGRKIKRMRNGKRRKDRRRGDTLSCLGPPASELSAKINSRKPVATSIILATDHTVKIWDNRNSWSRSCHGFSYHQEQCVHRCVWTRVCTSIIKACNPFSCLADPEGMLFPWQCQVVSLHYSWACTPAPVQGLSPCSNAIFITHTHTQTEKARGDCSCERGIDGNAITPNKQTLNHTLIPSQL